MTPTEELQAALDAQPKPDCAALTPFSVKHFDRDTNRVTLVFDPQPLFKNHFGNVQGGFAVAMVDVLVSVAAYAKTGKWLPTIEIKSTFVAPLSLGSCRGEATVVKAGAQLVFLEARLTGADGQLAVHATATVLMPTRD